MRVTHVVQSLQTGGLEKMVVHLSRGTAARGIPVEVVAYLEDGPLRNELEAAGIPVHILKGRTGLDARLPLLLGRHLAAGHVTHVHTHHVGPFLYAVPAARLLGISHVHTEHSHELYDASRRRLVGRLMEHGAVPVACSEEVARWRLDELGANSLVIENGVPAPPPGANRAGARSALGIADTAEVIIAVGRLAPEKNHAALLRAFALASHRPDATLVLVGDGPCRAALVQQAARLGLSQRIHFLGQRSDVPSILPAADVMAFSSDREALPLALLEGFAAGLPFVGTAVGELPALARAGTGVVFPAGDEAGLARGLEAMLNSPLRRRSEGLAAHRLWKARFSVDAMVSRYVALYRFGWAAAASQAA